MAFYKNASYLRQDNGNAFDQTYRPGAETPLSGIYRCTGCGHEMVSVKGHTLPPQNHHTHTLYQGDIRWQLIVMSTHVA